ncbi:MAG: hypothetical protein R3C56_27160 [Pirellulaceae bacterium]
MLRNPRHSGGSIHYSLNEFSYKINPGESQTIEHDRNWLLKFDNGLGKTLKVNLQPGTYEFRVSAESGWEVATKTAPNHRNGDAIRPSWNGLAGLTHKLA